MADVKWTYKGNRTEIDKFLENIKSLYVNEVHVKKPASLSSDKIAGLLQKSRKAFLTTDGTKLWMEVRQPDGSIVSLGLAKDGFDHSMY